MLDEVLIRLDRIETALAAIAEQKATKEFYTTAEVAEIVGRAEFTVREWCRLGRIDAVKQTSGIGRQREWRISHEELDRIRNHGPRPLVARHTKCG
ncbi:helix-turn-helix domain-containing protein [Stratiformator vulcanicus]|uniref:Helix-turn-helix domain protein n=1 Tax=Stratiformator vulcanicus TaxID=2527980 RepID=A0A517R3H4_9PLAN|nr:helix-turn-helix domain-containing protein [Stratiformator vulcanicus]QDT38406.1 Helix-turn-helix domain protein [Stratiformator vulcanicus]